MYTPKKVVVAIIKKGPAFNRQDAADWWELVDWKEVQEYKELIKQTEYEAMKGGVNMSERKKFKEIIQERLQTAELYAGVVEKMELWKGDYCLLTDQERAIAQAYGYNIECSNCAAKEQCDTYTR